MPAGATAIQVPSHRREPPEKTGYERNHGKQVGVPGPPALRSAEVTEADLSSPSQGAPGAEKVSFDYSDKPEVREAIACLLGLTRQVTGHPPIRVEVTPVGHHIDAHVYLTGEGIRRVYGRGARTHEAFRRLSGAISGRMGQSIRVRFHEVPSVPRNQRAESSYEQYDYSTNAK